MSEPTQELVQPFVLAAHTDLGKVQELYAEHPELLDVPWQPVNETAIQAASHMGRRDIAEWLLERGAPLRIYTAAMLGRTETVAALLAADPSLANARGAHGISLMYHAAMSGETAIPELLLARGGGEGMDGALHGAVAFGRLPMVEWLLAHGATNPNAPNFEGKTPLRAAIEKGYPEIADILRAHGGVEEQQAVDSPNS